jgi:aldehyde oxidoreductase
MYGGMAQGIGLALTEDFEDIKKHSTMVGAGFPYIKQIPDDMELIYVETPRPEGPFGASGVGELPLTSPMRRSSTRSTMPAARASPNCRPCRRRCWPR